jgi:hypothetical protein
MTDICYNQATDTVRAVIHGTFTACDLAYVRRALCDSPLFGKRALVDFTEGTALFSDEEVEYMARSGAGFGDVALVAPSGSSTDGLCRMFQTHACGCRRIACFADPVEAGAWLGSRPQR